MTEKELAALCAAVTPPDEAARAAAHAHWASLAKPLGGLGGLETTIEDAAPSPAAQSWIFPAGRCWCSAPITVWWPRASARPTAA